MHATQNEALSKFHLNIVSDVVPTKPWTYAMKR